MQVKVRHIKGMHFEGEGQSKIRTQFDSSVTAGGTGIGSSPMEMVLMAIAGCSGMDVVSILEKMRVSYQRFEISVQGERAAEHPRVFTDIEVIYFFWGEGLEEEHIQDKIKRALALSMEKYCSVANMIDKVANLTYKLEINPV
ncbi:OsmC family protein [Desulfitobacterium sp.]|uniref:OsmC family protein n=1 Tax=Desulfitobacterium sp. TaxID=49981 RepID=UPI002D0B3178|nr:OsmC family protein [Desulfitobacterium sp.]HVJ48613.1 OsmC family protein [Desulfitobacterium sp.]